MTHAPVNNTELNGKPAMSTARLEAELAARVDGEVRFDAGTRAAYAPDASNYRQVPIGVVVPRTVDAAVAAVAVCRELRRAGAVPRRRDQPGRPVRATRPWSSTGPSTATGWSSVDPEARTCVVEPGIVLDELNDALAPLRADGRAEAVHARQLHLGGMIGNNSCGATAQAYGKMVDNGAPAGGR